MDQFQYKINYFVIIQKVVYTIDISTEYYCVVQSIMMTVWQEIFQNAAMICTFGPQKQVLTSYQSTKMFTCHKMKEKGRKRKGTFSSELSVNDDDNLARKIPKCSNDMHLCTPKKVLSLLNSLPGTR